MLSFGLSLAYFTSTANSKGVSFSFAKLEVKVSTDGTNYSAETSVPLGNKTVGENIVNKVNVQLSSNSTASGFIRAKVYYSGIDDETSIYKLKKINIFKKILIIKIKVMKLRKIKIAKIIIKIKQLPKKEKILNNQIKFMLIIM